MAIKGLAKGKAARLSVLNVRMWKALYNRVDADQIARWGLDRKWVIAGKWVDWEGQEIQMY